MSTYAFIPIKEHSTRLKHKNFREISGVPLYQIIIDKALRCNFDEVIVDTDSDEIYNYANKLRLKIGSGNLSVPLQVRNGNNLLVYDYESMYYEKHDDLIFQLFATAPFLSIETINECIDILETCPQYDSVFTATKETGWFWNNNMITINYDPKVLPRSQDSTRIIKETTGLYGIRGHTLVTTNCRIGEFPYPYIVDHKEAIDIDTQEDLDYARYIANNSNNK